MSSILKWAVVILRLVLMVIKAKLVYTVAIVLTILLLVEFSISVTQIHTRTGRFKINSGRLLNEKLKECRLNVMTPIAGAYKFPCGTSDI
jgi:hypothetical protein